MPPVQVVESHQLEAGDFFILHRGGLGRGVPAMAAVLEGASDLRLIPFEFPSEPVSAFTAMHESALAGTALKVPDARLEIDYGSATNSAATYETNAPDAIIAVNDRLVLAMRFGRTVAGYLDLATGVIGRSGLGNAWMAFDRWRIVDGSEPPVQLFSSAAWEGQPNE